MSSDLLDSGADELSRACRIDSACDRFETAWKSGNRPTIEDHLGEIAGPERLVLARELIQLDIHYRRIAGQTCVVDDYTSRFLDLDANWLAAAISARAGGPTTSFVPVGHMPANGFDEELRQLLRSRLIFVHLIALALAMLLVVMILFAPSGPDPLRPSLPQILLHLVAFVEILIGSLVLWCRPGMSLRSLRMWELLFFGLQGAIGGVSRFEALALVDETVQIAPVTTVGFRGLTSLGVFFVLILAYGVLIPNTRRRTLFVVAALAAVPLVALPPAVAVSSILRQGHSLPLALQWAFVMAFPVAIAVFVAAQTTALQRRAFEAERRAEQIGQYALKRKLGEGGMGEVWLAEHALLKRPCAVKFIRPNLAAHPATAARFAREVQAVTGLTHLNTVRVYDYGRAEDGSFYYVMEYLDGPTLEELVRQTGPLPSGRVVYLLRQVCGALVEAHAAGLIHRDLKPGNIIITALGGRHDTAKLLDFGLVQDLSTDTDQRLTRTGTVLGTPAYMSPEQAAGEWAVDARGDVYGLGAVAFFALTGRPPFQGKTLGQLLAAHRSEPPPPVTDLQPDVPADMAAVVARCLAKDPNDRFQSAADLDRALGQCGCAADWSAERAAEVVAVERGRL
jgi:serine/threonine-protein kinase